MEVGSRPEVLCCSYCGGHKNERSFILASLALALWGL